MCIRDRYTLYRTKLRELTESTEFSTDTENTKFPIAPEFYNKIYKVDFPTEDYLTTAGQFIEMGKHRLKKFKDKIAYFLTLKSETDATYFNDLLTQYEAFKTMEEKGNTNMNPNLDDNKAFLEKIIKEANDALES